ncbi:DUF4331 family protein, partial [Candidatus Acetothermia bacterium]|nr:DUF4331 family protein [Candidatus Acetothermia bacterium]
HKLNRESPEQYYFSTNARYEFKVTRVNNNDDMATGKADVTLRFEFGIPDSAGRQNLTVTAIADKTTRFARATTNGSPIRTTPLNTNVALNQVSLLGSTLTVFAGMREDPFFFDVEQYFRVRAGALGIGPKVGFRKPGLDFAAGYGVNSIIVRIPRSFLQGPTTAKTLDVWETISVKTPGNNFHQFERIGRPAINEGLIVSQNLLALFNSIGPDEDLKPVAAPIRAEAAKTLAAFGNDQNRINALVGALLPDVLRIDTTQPSSYAAAFNAKGSPIRGRMLMDDVIDTTIQVATNNPNAGDNASYFGPNQGGTSHKPLLTKFPYLADLNPSGAGAGALLPENKKNTTDGFSVQNITATVSAHSVLFQAQGMSINGIQVQIFTLNGKPVFDSGLVAGNQLTWGLTDTEGKSVPANGTYVYVLTAKSSDGTSIRSELKKLAIVR